MKTVIVGDIGGQLDVFKDVVKSVGGDPETCILPSDVTMIQVGDIVRFNPSNELDSVGCAMYAQKLIEVNDGRYIQLLGNHESPLLGGAWCPNWKVIDLPESKPIVQKWWTEKTCSLGVVLRKPGQKDILVTHAGLTRGFMQTLGTESAVDTALTLNSYVGNVELREFENPGRLVTGKVNMSADTFWALLGSELHESWRGNHPDFNQIHGHSTLIEWESGRLFDIAEDVLSATSINYRDRYSVTVYDSGYTLRSVDWALQNHHQRMRWPLLVLNGYEIIR